MKTVGIFGMGKLGTVIGRLALAGGWRVLVAPSPRQTAPELIIGFMIPGAEVVDAAQLVDQSDLIVASVPHAKADQLPWQSFDDKIVIDPMNHWEPVDGPMDPRARQAASLSQYTASRNPRMRLVKALGQLGYHDLEELSSHNATDDARRALGLASDDLAAKAEVADLVTSLGFDPVDLGGLPAGAALDAGAPLFGRALTANQLRAEQPGGVAP